MSKKLLPTAYCPLPCHRGFTLVETLVGSLVFAVVAIASYQAFAVVIGSTMASRARTTATMLGNERIEIIRNLPYLDVGIVGGVPVGEIPREENVSRGGFAFNTITSVRNVDDPFDGTVGGSPNDLSPADYKLVEVTINCSNCKNYSPISFTTYIAPKGPEDTDADGALRVTVINALGQIVPNATVRIVNSSASPAIDITETTNNQGEYLLVGAPEGNLAYNVSATKGGYSTDSTFSVSHDNPDPIKPPATVSAGQITHVTLAIDKTSTFTLSTIAENCSVLASKGVTLRGEKLVGGSSDRDSIYKVNTNYTSNTSGLVNISALEWDTYNILPNDSTKTVVGTIPELSQGVLPDTQNNMKILMADKSGSGLLVNIKDSVSGLPLPDATVHLSRGAYSSIKTSTTTSATGCEPAGQVFFDGLSTSGSSYTLTISKTGYNTVVDDEVKVTEDWQRLDFSLSPTN